MMKKTSETVGVEMDAKTGCAGCDRAAPTGCAQDHCGACCGGGCAALPETLSSGERRLLEDFGQLAFLPLVREKESGLVTLLGTDLSESLGRTAAHLHHLVGKKDRPR